MIHLFNARNKGLLASPHSPPSSPSPHSPPFLLDNIFNKKYTNQAFNLRDTVRYWTAYHKVSVQPGS